MKLTKKQLKKIIKEELNQVSDIRKIYMNLQRTMNLRIEEAKESFINELSNFVSGAKVEVYDAAKSVGTITNVSWDASGEVLFEVVTENHGVRLYNLEEFELI